LCYFTIKFIINFIRL